MRCCFKIIITIRCGELCADADVYIGQVLKLFQGTKKWNCRKRFLNV